jgi:hypothetical protein
MEGARVVFREKHYLRQQSPLHRPGGPYSGQLSGIHDH